MSKTNKSRMPAEAGAKAQVNGYETYKARQMANPDFRRAYEEGLDLLRLGVEIASLREKKGLTQTQLAAMLGTSASVISRVENGENVEMKTLRRIAIALHAEIRMKLVPISAP